ncbi:MAG: hypothetical protein MJZ93_02340 [Paludibacteraceae bacterium]|nr:hypothetical protein [Paludibacteraceae bacterium]
MSLLESQESTEDVSLSSLFDRNCQVDGKSKLKRDYLLEARASALSNSTQKSK